MQLLEFESASKDQILDNPSLFANSWVFRRVGCEQSCDCLGIICSARAFSSFWEQLLVSQLLVRQSNLHKHQRGKRFFTHNGELLRHPWQNLWQQNLGFNDGNPFGSMNELNVDQWFNTLTKGHAVRVLQLWSSKLGRLLQSCICMKQWKKFHPQRWRIDETELLHTPCIFSCFVCDRCVCSTMGIFQKQFSHISWHFHAGTNRNEVHLVLSKMIEHKHGCPQWQQKCQEELFCPVFNKISKKKVRGITDDNKWLIGGQKTTSRNMWQSAPGCSSDLIVACCRVVALWVVDSNNSIKMSFFAAKGWSISVLGPVPLTFASVSMMT